jgi:hypothetical protein
MFYATARQRNAEKEMSEATLRKMHRKVVLTHAQPMPNLNLLKTPFRLKYLRAK